MSESESANSRNTPLPAYVTQAEPSEFENARFVFLLRLAALYATEEGTVTALAERLGRSRFYFHPYTHREKRLSGDTAYQIEALCGGVVTRKDLRPDLFA